MDHNQDRRARAEFLAIDPASRELTRKVRLTPQRLRTFTSQGELGTIKTAKSLEGVFKNPFSIFQGLTEIIDESPGPTQASYDDDKRGWQYYVGVPTHCYDSDGTEHPWPPRNVMIVEVKEDGTITRWWKEKCDSPNDLVPNKHSVRFQKQLYLREAAG